MYGLTCTRPKRIRSLVCRVGTTSSELSSCVRRSALWTLSPTYRRHSSSWQSCRTLFATAIHGVTACPTLRDKHGRLRHVRPELTKLISLILPTQISWLHGLWLARHDGASKRAVTTLPRAPSACHECCFMPRREPETTASLALAKKAWLTTSQGDLRGDVRFCPFYRL